MVDFDEPMQRLFNQGMILGPTARRCPNRSNVINPDEVVDRYSADTVRIPDVHRPVGSGRSIRILIEGVHRFLHRVWAVVTEDVQLEKPLLDAGGAVDGPGARWSASCTRPS